MNWWEQLLARIDTLEPWWIASKHIRGHAVDRNGWRTQADAIAGCIHV